MSGGNSIEYRDAPGLAGYRVGNDGSVWSAWGKEPLRGKGQSGTRSVLTDNWRKLNPGFMRCGHLRVNLGRYGMRLVHRLVLEAFIGPCPPGMECCHEDDNPANNHVTNLRWGTRKENMADRVKNGILTRGEQLPVTKLTADAVRRIRFEHSCGRSRQEISSTFGVHRNTINDVIFGRTWKHVK